LRAFEARPADLVITDIVMPGREGTDTIHSLRRQNPTLKIIAISGGASVGGHDFLDVTQKFGADRSLAKPFGDQQLLSTVQDILQPTNRLGRRNGARATCDSISVSLFSI
jgi:YesN/AraC family two-component response regulator